MTSEYMIIPCDAERKQWVYEEQILHNNDIQYLLKFQLREVNHQMQYFYNIQGLRMVAELWEKRPASRDDLRQLMRSIGKSVRLLDEYLLNPDNIYLDERFIYQQLDGSGYMFTYVPGYEVPLKQQLKELISWVMKHMNYNQKESVSYIYMLYKDLEEDKNILDLIDPVEVSNDDKESTVEPQILVKESVLESKEAEQLQETESFWNYSLLIKAVIGCILFVTGTVIFRQSIQLWFRRQLGISIFPWLIPLISFCTGAVLCSLSFVMIRIQNKKHCPDKENKDFWQGEHIIDFSSIKANETDVLENIQTHQETQLMNKQYMVLKKENGEEKDTIHVCSLPFTIGKNKEVVQYHIDSRVISRRHLQITKDNNRYVLTDLHSTNGTWINGSKLVPGKAYDICDGDILQIADVSYRVEISEM